MSVTRRVAAASIALAALVVSTPASAHVTIPDPGEQGGFSIVTFSVPNERSDEATSKLEVKLPEDHPLPFVSVQPKPGWTSETTMRKLDDPVKAFGESYDEVVDTVTWSGGEIGDGQFDTFALSVGPLPDDVDSLTFPAIQTYGDGEEVSWIEVTPDSGEEPEHPAPVLRLVAGADAEAGQGDEGDDGVTATTAASAAAAVSPSAADVDGDSDDTDPVAIAALAVGVVAVLLAGGAFVTARRRSV